MATARKARIRVDRKTRRTVKEPIDPPSPARTSDPELPAPEPIKLWTAKGGGNGAPSQKAAPPAPSAGMRLDLACGQSPRDGFEGVDLHGQVAKHRVDLLKFPWPWPDNSVDELNCSHFIEHIPIRDVELDDIVKGDAELMHFDQYLGRDMLFAFFDECWRILKPNAALHVVVPSVRSERAFQDPTHRRFIAQATFFYLNEDWRKANKLDHYRVRCNFAGDVNFTFPIEYQSRHESVQKEAFDHAWNVVLDYMVTLKALKTVS